MARQDIPEFKPWGDVTVDLLTRPGMKVDYVAVDWGTVVQRPAQKSPPGQGGWQICIDGTNKRVRANGEKASFWRPNIPHVEAEVAAWFDATHPFPDPS
jgi:peptide/nickel transport system substrate-binding protein